MCGRFAIKRELDEMARAFTATPANDLPPTPNYNICPTMPIATVALMGGQRHLRPMRWGFIPEWYKTPTDGPLLINARAETLAEKPAFRAACRQRRCLIPADGFFEWTKTETGTRLPWYIHRRDGAPLAFAGVWQDWGPQGARSPTCAIVTTAANATMAPIHHRMPVCIAAPDWGLWLGQEGRGAARLMQAPAEDLLIAHRVDPAVNSNRASGPQLIEPIVIEES